VCREPFVWLRNTLVEQHALEECERGLVENGVSLVVTGDVKSHGPSISQPWSAPSMPVWLRLMGALGTPMFNFKVVR